MGLLNLGIIGAAVSGVSGSLGDQYLDALSSNRMDNRTLMSYGSKVRSKDRRDKNNRATEDIISNGSVIHVQENEYMLLIDGGKIISATDTPGYYRVDNSAAPSLFFKSEEGVEAGGYSNKGGGIVRPGGFKNTLKDTWERVKFGGGTPQKQMVIYINKQEIPDIKFGTPNPVTFYDENLDLDLELRAFGSYSIKIVDPLLFYAEVCAKGAKKDFTVEELSGQYLNEFLMAFCTALSSLSMEGIRFSRAQAEAMKLGKYMADVLDEDWLMKRGFLINSVGIGSISPSESTKKIIEKRNAAAALKDQSLQAGAIAGGFAEGIAAAGSNSGGAMQGFMGVGMGMNAMGASPFGGLFAQQQPQQPQAAPPQTAPTPPAAPGWTCACGAVLSNDSIFCNKCGGKKPAPASGWTCACGNVIADGIFCNKCGSKKPEAGWTCQCGNNVSEGIFCNKCGTKKP